jgi:spermidine/putrescine transport system permease protein
MMRAFSYSRTTRAVLYTITACIYLFIFAPILLVVYASFDPNEIFSFPYSGFSLRWYREFVNNPLFYETIENSVTLGVAAGCGAVLVGGLSAYAIARLQIKGGTLYHAMILSPLVVSKVVLGMAVLLLMVRVGIPRGWVALITLHVMLCAPLAFLVILARLQTLGRDYEEAALSLGADEIQTAWHVTIPLMMPALMGAALLAFTVSFDEFSATQFVATPYAQTVPIQIYSMIKTGVSPTVNVFSTFLISITILVPALAQYLFGAFRRGFLKR